jgi:hypothetical protein
MVLERQVSLIAYAYTPQLCFSHVFLNLCPADCFNIEGRNECIGHGPQREGERLEIYTKNARVNLRVY